MRLLVWAFRAFIFFTLFAFALNNQQDAVVHWFFGTQWQAPMVIVVLAAFALGCALGVLAMVPAWWRQRRDAQRPLAAEVQQPPTPAPHGAEFTTPEQPPRTGL